jgi:hypothetical protein
MITSKAAVGIVRKKAGGDKKYRDKYYISVFLNPY